MKAIKRDDLKVGEYGDFGTGVSLSGDLTTLGVEGDTDSEEGLQGAVYLLSRNQWAADNWGLVKKIVGDGHIFGRDVALEGDTLVVGCYESVKIFARDKDGTDNLGPVATIALERDENSHAAFGGR